MAVTMMGPMCEREQSTLKLESGIQKLALRDDRSPPSPGDTQSSEDDKSSLESKIQKVTLHGDRREESPRETQAYEVDDLDGHRAPPTSILSSTMKTTSQSQAPRSEDRKPPTLLDLPVEIRRNILKYCLDCRYCAREEWALMPEKISNHDFKSIPRKMAYEADENLATSHEWLLRRTYRRSYALHPNVLRVCKTLYREGTDVLYSDNKFVVFFGVPEAWRATFPKTGTGISWRLKNTRQYLRAFMCIGRDVYGCREPAISIWLFDIRGVTGQTKTHLVLLEDFGTAMHSLFRCLMHQEPRSSLLERNSRALIDINVRRQYLPGLITPKGEDITRRLADMMFPWIGRWVNLYSIEYRQQTIKLGLVRQNRPTHYLASFRYLDYIHLAKWQHLALVRQLEDLRLVEKVHGPSKQVIQGLIFVVHQARDLLFALRPSYILQPEGETNATFRLIAVAAWRLAHLDVSSIRGLSPSELIAIKRLQILYMTLGMQIKAPRPITATRWLVKTRLRVAVLANELGVHDLANLFLHGAVAATMPKGSSIPEWKLSLRQAVEDAGLPRVLFKNTYCNANAKPSDFLLLATTWAESVGCKEALSPDVPETKHALQIGHLAWRTLYV